MGALRSSNAPWFFSLFVNINTLFTFLSPFSTKTAYTCVQLRTECADFSCKLRTHPRTVAYSSAYYCVLTALPIYIELLGDNLQYLSYRYVAKLSIFGQSKSFPLPFFQIIVENTIKLLGVYRIFPPSLLEIVTPAYWKQYEKIAEITVFQTKLLYKNQ